MYWKGRVNGAGARAKHVGCASRASHMARAHLARPALPGAPRDGGGYLCGERLFPLLEIEGLRLLVSVHHFIPLIWREDEWRLSSLFIVLSQNTVRFSLYSAL